MKIKLINYRCFHESHPLEFELNDGFTSFIGVNNSGKSSILKFFYEFRELFNQLTDYNHLNRAIKNQGGFNYSSSIYDTTEIFNNISKNDIKIEISTVDENNIPISIIITVPYGRNVYSVDFKIKEEVVHQDSINLSSLSNKVSSISSQGVSLKPIIDICGDLANTLYIGPFRNALNKGEDNSYYDLQIGEAFIRQWKSMKEGNNKRQNEAAIELEEELTRIFEFDSLQINPSEDCKTLKIIVDKKSYMLPELGAGLAQFIVVLASTFVKKPRYVLIDEPELHLHPSLQLDFLTTLASQTNTGGIVFATHSPGLAHTSSEKSYIVKQISSGKSVVEETRKDIPLTALLGELSYPGYRELGRDTILLVEGTHDVKVFQQFLRFYSKEHDIVILPLGGGSLISANTKDQLKEISKLSKNIFAVVDSEKTSADATLSEDRVKFKENCEVLGITCHILERRATENYLTESAIQIVKSNKYSQLSEYQLLKATNPSWGKHENWLIARNMTIDDIKGTDLFSFLEDVTK